MISSVYLTLYGLVDCIPHTDNFRISVSNMAFFPAGVTLIEVLLVLYPAPPLSITVSTIFK